MDIPQVTHGLEGIERDTDRHDHGFDPPAGMEDVFQRGREKFKILEIDEGGKDKQNTACQDGKGGLFLLSLLKG